MGKPIYQRKSLAGVKVQQPQPEESNKSVFSKVHNNNPNANTNNNSSSSMMLDVNMPSINQKIDMIDHQLRGNENQSQTQSSDSSVLSMIKEKDKLKGMKKKDKRKVKKERFLQSKTF